MTRKYIPLLREIVEEEQPRSVLFVPLDRIIRCDLTPGITDEISAYASIYGNALDEMRVTMPTRFENALAFLHDTCFTDVKHPTRDHYDLVFVAGESVGRGIRKVLELQELADKCFVEISPNMSQLGFEQSRLLCGKDILTELIEYFRINKTGKKMYDV